MCNMWRWIPQSAAIAAAMFALPVMTESGNLVVVEVKGPHLDGTDSQEKAELGKTWADMAGTHFKYFMVFKKAGDGVPGAMLLNDFLNTLVRL